MASPDNRALFYRWFISLRSWTILAVLLLYIGSFIVGYSLKMPEAWLEAQYEEAVSQTPASFIERLIQSLVSILPGYVPYFGIGYVSFNVGYMGMLAQIHPIPAAVGSAIVIMIALFPSVDSTVVVSVLAVSKLKRLNIPQDFPRRGGLQFLYSVIASIMLLLIYIILT